MWIGAEFAVKRFQLGGFRQAFVLADESTDALEHGAGLARAQRDAEIAVKLTTARVPECLPSTKRWLRPSSAGSTP